MSGNNSKIEGLEVTSAQCSGPTHSLFPGYVHEVFGDANYSGEANGLVVNPLGIIKKIKDCESLAKNRVKCLRDNAECPATRMEREK